MFVIAIETYGWLEEGKKYKVIREYVDAWNNRYYDVQDLNNNTYDGYYTSRFRLCNINKRIV